MSINRHRKSEIIINFEIVSDNEAFTCPGWFIRRGNFLSFESSILWNMTTSYTWIVILVISMGLSILDGRCGKQ